MCLETQNCFSKKNVDARRRVSLSTPVITSISIDYNLTVEQTSDIIDLCQFQETGSWLKKRRNALIHIGSHMDTQDVLVKYLNVQRNAERYQRCLFSGQMSLDSRTNMGRGVTEEDVTVTVKPKQQAMEIVRWKIMKATICISL